MARKKKDAWMDEYRCVWCDGFMPFTPWEDINEEVREDILIVKCSCILCDKCRERILLKDRVEGTRECRKCLYGFVY